MASIKEGRFCTRRALRAEIGEEWVTDAAARRDTRRGLAMGWGGRWRAAGGQKRSLWNNGRTRYQTPARMMGTPAPSHQQTVTRINHDAPLPPSPACAPTAFQPLPPACAADTENAPRTLGLRLHAPPLQPPAPTPFNPRSLVLWFSNSSNSSSSSSESRILAGGPSALVSPFSSAFAAVAAAASAAALRLSAMVAVALGKKRGGGYGGRGIRGGRSGATGVRWVCAGVCEEDGPRRTDGLREHFSGKPYFEYS